MPLTDARLRNARAGDRPYKLSDGGGLHCLVTPAGGRLWRVKFRFNGKEKLLTLGDYPRISLIEARRRFAEARALIDQGRDPAAEKQAAKKPQTAASAPMTFEQVARAWHETRRHTWTPKYAEQVLTRLRDDVFPELGPLPIAEIEPQDVLAVLRVVEARGVLETTRRLKQYASSIFRFAIAAGHCKHDPAAPLQGALRPPSRPKHHTALPTDLVGPFLNRLDLYDGEAETRIALKLALLTVVRTKELRCALWKEFEHVHDPQRATWRIPADRMKMRQPHLVPLSRQACAALEELKALSRGGPFLFPGSGAEAVMSNNTMLFALYRMGYRGVATTHGFRRLFSTEANEKGFNADWIERQLAHDERDQVRGAYNAAQYLPQRREMLQWWADELDRMKEAAARESEGQDGAQE